MLTPTELIYYGACFAKLHKNPVFINALTQSYIIYIERIYFG